MFCSLFSFVVFGAVAYWIVGYALAFGGGNEFAGDTFWASSDMEDTGYAHWFFHFVFAATAATIVSGAMAERCDFIAYITYSFSITGMCNSSSPKEQCTLVCDGVPDPH